MALAGTAVSLSAISLVSLGVVPEGRSDAAEEALTRGVALLHDPQSGEDITRAVEQVVAAASAGLPRAKTWLGHLGQTGLVVSYDPESAFRHYLEAAMETYPAAQYAVGTCYRMGFGVARNAEKADQWFGRTIQAGARSETVLDGDSLRAIGLCYRDGFGVSRDAEAAAQWLTRAGDAGQPAALAELGDLVRAGVGVEPDPAAAAALYHRAANQGSIRAALALARLCAEGSGVHRDRELAEEWVQRAVRGHLVRAARGSVEDATALFELFMDQTLMPARPEQALAWLRRAANQGYGRAETRLGRCYALGLGVEADVEEALAWLRKAADQQEGEASFLLWQLLRSADPPDPDQALRHLHQAAEFGSITAMHTLGDWYRQFGEGPDASANEAHWYRRALDGYALLAGQGEVQALAALIAMYSRGRGVEADPQRALVLLKRAAVRDRPNAQFSLAAAYEHGDHLEPDAGEALRWYRRAADQDYVPALLSLAVIHENGQLGTEPDPAKAMALLAQAFTHTRQAAESGDPEAQLLLSSMYLEGIGTAGDPALAMDWLHRSARNGHVPAQLEMASRYSRGSLLPRHVDAALMWIERVANQGSPEGQYLLGKAYDSSDAMEHDYVEAYKWFSLAADQGFQPAREYMDELEVTLSTAERVEALERARRFRQTTAVTGDAWIEAESFTR